MTDLRRHHVYVQDPSLARGKPQPLGERAQAIADQCNGARFNIVFQPARIMVTVNKDRRRSVMPGPRLPRTTPYGDAYVRDPDAFMPLCSQCPRTYEDALCQDDAPLLRCSAPECPHWICLSCRGTACCCWFSCDVHTRRSRMLDQLESHLDDARREANAPRRGSVPFAPTFDRLLMLPLLHNFEMCDFEWCDKSCKTYRVKMHDHTPGPPPRRSYRKDTNELLDIIEALCREARHNEPDNELTERKLRAMLLFCRLPIEQIGLRSCDIFYEIRGLREDVDLFYEKSKPSAAAVATVAKPARIFNIVNNRRRHRKDDEEEQQQQHTERQSLKKRKIEQQQRIQIDLTNDDDDEEEEMQQ